MTTIRVSEQTRETPRVLSQARGESIQEIAAKAIEQFRRQQLLDASNAAYARLQEDSEAWKSLRQEYADWDETLSDGLDDA